MVERHGPTVSLGEKFAILFALFCEAPAGFLTRPCLMSEERDTPELSLVVPVYNGSRTIGPLVEQIEMIFATKPFDIILVNDGSEDDSEMICSELAEKFPQTVTFVNLSRNFGEHNAVLAGLSHARGQYVAVLDDDGQNPPEEILRMLEELKRNNYDVVYGRYVEKKHSWFRNAGSWFNDRVATFLLQKPKDLYFSSFKVMNRFLVNEIIKYRGPYPYADGLIYRTTRKIGQILVEHRANLSGASRYTFRKLVRLWLNMFLNFSIKPLRLSAYIGLFTSCLSVLGLICIFIDKVWIEPGWPVGIPTVLASIVFFAGVELMILGVIGEYLGRLYLDQTGTPQYVVRYTIQAGSEGERSLGRPPDDKDRAKRNMVPIQVGT
jgi:glycosyltransferase involved in cell wall biosynthesis